MMPHEQRPRLWMGAPYHAAFANVICASLLVFLTGSPSWALMGLLVHGGLVYLRWRYVREGGKT